MHSIQLAFWALSTLAAAGHSDFATTQEAERAAKKACLAGDPAKGVDILAELYVNTNDITYIFNQGRCLEQNSRYQDAIARFREYLLKGETRLGAEDKAVAQKHIDACTSYLANASAAPVEAPAGSTTPAGAATAPTVLSVAAQPTPAQGSPGAGLRTAGVVTAAVGAAALLTGVVLNLKVNSMAGDLEKPDNFDRDTDSDRKTYKTLGWAAYGAGAACLVGGSLLYYLGWRAGRDRTTGVTLVASFVPGGAGAALQGGF